MSTSSKRSRRHRDVKRDEKRKREHLHSVAEPSSVELAMPTVSPQQIKKAKSSEVANQDIARLLRDLRADTIDSLDDFYSTKVEFEDPLVKLSGRDAFKKYTGMLFRFGDDVQFQVLSESGNSRQKSVTWILSFKPKTRWLRTAKIEIPGMSEIRFEDGLAVYHRDYFDLAGSVLSNIPWFGRGARMLKSRVGKLISEKSV